MLDGGLTHMNGRLYDPVLARFVSADPHVDNPFDLQSLNRYSYVNNNPLGYTDPTGYFKLFGKKWSWWRDKVVKPVVAIAASFLLGPNGAWALTNNAFANTLIAGAVSGGITGGGQGAFLGALTGGLFYGAGQIAKELQSSFATFANDGLGRAALHAVAGCVSSSAGGGDCGKGALTAGFTKFAASNIDVGNADLAKLVKYAVIGGTASSIGGGKFANGAMTGAWQYLFNEKVAWMDKNGNIHPGEHPAHKGGTCGMNANCAAGIADPRPPNVSREAVADFFGRTARYSEYAAAASALSLQPEGVVGFSIASGVFTFAEQAVRPNVVDVVRGGMIDVMVEPLPMQYQVPAGLVVKEVIKFKESNK